MTMHKLLAGVFVANLAVLTPMSAEPTTPQPAATSQPAAETASADSAYISRQSWERHFTIPPFVQTSKGFGMKSSTTRPAGASEAASYWASRQRRTNADATTSTGGQASSGRSSRRAGGEGGYSDRSSRSSRSDRGSSRSDRGSSRSERGSSRSSSRGGRY